MRANQCTITYRTGHRDPHNRYWSPVDSGYHRYMSQDLNSKDGGSKPPHCVGLWGWGGGVGTRPGWLALLACGGAYWPLGFEPSAMTSRLGFGGGGAKGVHSNTSRTEASQKVQSPSSKEGEPGAACDGQSNGYITSGCLRKRHPGALNTIIKAVDARKAVPVSHPQTTRESNAHREDSETGSKYTRDPRCPSGRASVHRCVLLPSYELVAYATWQTQMPCNV